MANFLCMQVVQQGLDVLCVSQFTLFNIMKGNKPDFHLAMPPSQVCGQSKQYFGQSSLFLAAH